MITRLNKGLAITGKALRYNKKASSNAKMTLLLKPKASKDPLLALGECDSSGRFAFYNLDFQDSCQMLVQAVKPKGGNNNDYGLNWYHYGARFYDAAIGRFPVVDRFSEKYLNFSPYQYASNKPIKYLKILRIAPLRIFTTNIEKQLKNKAISVYFVKNTEGYYL